MKKALLGGAFFVMTSLSVAQTTYDSKTLVDTNNNSTSTSTVTTTNNNNSTSTSTSTSTVNSSSTNTNNNVNTSTSTSENKNININSGEMTYTNKNINSGEVTYNNKNINSGEVTYINKNTSASTSDNKNVNVNTSTSDNKNVNVNTSTSENKNINVNSGEMTNKNINTSTSDNKNTNINASTSVNQNIQSGDMTNRNINDTNITQRVIQPPPTTIAPTMMSGGNTDLCTTGTSGAVQTQIFGVSSGGTVRDLNCERLKLSKTLFDMGMKVAAVATMCQDRRVFDAMMAAGTPCPVEGQIGAAAKAYWEANPDKLPKLDEVKDDETYKKIGIGSLLGVAVYKLFGF